MMIENHTPTDAELMILCEHLRGSEWQDNWPIETMEAAANAIEELRAERENLRALTKHSPGDYRIWPHDD